VKGILMAVVSDIAALVAAVTPAHEKIHAHHVTLAFGVTADAADVLDLVGREINVVAFDAVNGDGVQAIRVKLPDGIPCGNAHPHITVSTADGVPPVKSNELCATVPAADTLEMTIPCRIEFVPFKPR
jgi:hypothetical protein